MYHDLYFLLLKKKIKSGVATMFDTKYLDFRSIFLFIDEHISLTPPRHRLIKREYKEEKF